MWVQALHATAVDVQRKVAKQHGSSTINFMVYCNGVIFFHKSVDFTGHNQDVQYIFGVIIILLRCSLLLTPHIVLMVMFTFFRRLKRLSLN
jgi:hypothetical protein